MNKLPHFVHLSDYSGATLSALIERATVLKQLQRKGTCPTPLKNKHVILIFSKPSTRTRLSFEIGVRQLGGTAIFLSTQQTQLGRGESIADTARVMSSMSDAVVIRETKHSTITEFRDAASVPVINALSEHAHPCQVLADMQTYHEHRGSIKNRIVVWLGDANNMCKSYIEASELFGFQLRISTPKDVQLPESLPACVEIAHNPEQAAQGAHLLITDTWHSMGADGAKQYDREKLRDKFGAYQLNQKLLSLAHPEAVYLHCLPAYRGEEISEELMERPDTVIWDAAENRLHAQKALLEFVFKQ